MDRETFIQKAMRGEEVVLDDVLRSQAEQELESIKTEANERVEAERRRKETAHLREAQFAEMVELAEEAKQILAEEAENEAQQVEISRQFAEKQIELRGRYHRTYTKFAQIFQFWNGDAYQNPHAPSSVSDELKNRGADLNCLEFDLTRRPLSPLAQHIADERFRGRASLTTDSFFSGL